MVIQALRILLQEGITNYFEKFKKAAGSLYVNKSSCVAVIASTDNQYWGTFPSGYVEAKDYKSGGALKNGVTDTNLLIIKARMTGGESINDSTGAATYTNASKGDFDLVEGIVSDPSGTDLADTFFTT